MISVLPVISSGMRVARAISVAMALVVPDHRGERFGVVTVGVSRTVGGRDSSMRPAPFARVPAPPGRL